MGFGNSAFQSARIAIDGVTIIENIYSGKIETSSSGIQTPKSIISSPSSGTAWGYATYLNQSTPLVNAIETVSWNTPSPCISMLDAVSLTGTGTIDGTVSNSTGSGKASSITANLTTSDTNDLIMVQVVFSIPDAYYTPFITISDANSLTWKTRFSTNYNSSSVVGTGTITGMTIFYATSASALSSDTITINAKTSSGSDYSMYLFIQAYGINGADLTNPFDPNSSLPGTYSTSGSQLATALSTGVINTTGKTTMLLGFWGGGNSSSGFASQGSGVVSISSSDDSLSFSPSTGVINAILNTANANTWTNQQTFDISGVTLVGTNAWQIVTSAGTPGSSNGGIELEVLSADGGLASALTVVGGTIHTEPPSMLMYGKIVNYAGVEVLGSGIPAIYGYDIRIGVNSTDTSPITLYTTTSSGLMVFKITATLFATSGSSASYVISWTESSSVRTQTITVSSTGVPTSSLFTLISDPSTVITVQLTAISSTTVNISTILEWVA